MSVPNQKIINKAVNDKYTGKPEDGGNFARIHLDAMNYAMKDLTPVQFKVWCYLCRIAPGTTDWEVSPADALQNWGISKDSFQKSIRVLIEKKYLVETSPNHFDFYDKPKEDKEEIIYITREKENGAVPAQYNYDTGTVNPNEGFIF